MVGELHEFEMNLNDIISSGGYCMRLCLKKTKTKTRNKTNKQTNRIVFLIIKPDYDVIIMFF